MSDRVLLDPSLLVGWRRLRKTESETGKLVSVGVTFVIPKSFSDSIRGGSSFDLNNAFMFFLGRKDIPYSDDVVGTLRRITDRYAVFTPTPLQRERHKEFLEVLSGQDVWGSRIPDPLVLDIVREEWIFLHEGSWIVSRIRKHFDKFIKAGAPCLQFGKKATDALIRRTLKRKDNDPITMVDKLRAVGKWIIVGGIPFWSPTPPAFASAAGLFSLLDP